MTVAQFKPLKTATPRSQSSDHLTADRTRSSVEKAKAKAAAVEERIAERQTESREARVGRSEPVSMGCISSKLLPPGPGGDGRRATVRGRVEHVVSLTSTTYGVLQS